MSVSCLRPSGSQHLVQILLDLTRPDGRDSAVSLLNRELGCDEIVLFIFDEVVSHYLPAPGFPQSLPSMRSWRNLLGECPVPGTITGELLSPRKRERTRATIVRPDQSCALAMLGGVPRSEILQYIVPLLPIAAAALGNEYAVHVKDAELRMAQRSAEEANRLAKTLDSVRQELRDTIAALIAQTVELTRSNSELQQFSYMASHDLQEPLRMVSVFGELLKRRYSGAFRP
jgi:signal transduction histidine kinase